MGRCKIIGFVLVAAVLHRLLTPTHKTSTTTHNTGITPPLWVEDLHTTDDGASEMVSFSQLRRWFAADVSVGDKALSDSVEPHLGLNPISDEIFSAEWEASLTRCGKVSGGDQLAGAYAQMFLSSFPVLDNAVWERYSKMNPGMDSADVRMAIHGTVVLNVVMNSLRSFLSTCVKMGYVQLSDDAISVVFQQ